MALKSAARCAEAASCSSSSRISCLRRPAAVSSRRLVVRAAADNSVSAPSSAGMPPVPVWPQDTETARDVFAFAGSLPERLNGRMAMLGFAGIALAELKDKVPAAEQLGNDVAGVALLSLLFTLASIFPKFTSGSSLKDLHAAATGDHLRGDGALQILGIFDTNVELWTGRIAMLGLTGLFAVEAVTGKVFF